MWAALAKMKWGSFLDYFFGYNVLVLGDQGIERTVHVRRTTWLSYIPFSQINKLVIEPPTAIMRNVERGSFPPCGAVTADLVAEDENGDAAVLLASYPRQWVIPIAVDLSRRINNENLGMDEISVYDRTLSSFARTNISEQPDSSSIHVDKNSSRLLLSVPPIGFKKSNLEGALASLLFITGGLAFIYASFRLLQPANSLSQWLSFDVILSVGIVAFAVGLYTCFSNLYVTFARTDYEIDSTRMIVFEHKVMMTSEKSWLLEDIFDIRAVGPENDGKSIRLFLSDGYCINLNYGRNEEELCWLATRLRNAALISNS